MKWMEVLVPFLCPLLSLTLSAQEQGTGGEGTISMSWDSLRVSLPVAPLP